MPVYNAKRLLRRAIDSVLTQKHGNLELICADDGSTDGSAEILESYGDQLITIKCAHRGAPAARNAALARATGNFITFLDADDQFTPNALASQLAAYNARVGDSVDFVTLGRSTAIFETDESRNNYFLNPEQSENMHLSVLGAVFAPAEVFKKTGGFNESLLAVDDTDWFMRLSDLGIKIVLNEATTLLITRHEANLTNQSTQVNRAHLELFRSRILKKRNG